MLIHAFLSLAIFERAEYVRRNGVYLIGRLEGIFLYKLFEMDGYFIEIKINYKEDHIEAVNTFQDNIRLSPYLEIIDIF
ncbi:hypothetical protein [Catalinimonas niigatensis]|uniref:hypothetical protein n=1 Tax=Catalinimonas niigatensis TaxID=1397264 RepID=UPI0026670B95|nr:hypothetical protein [Catalinimonas niigatensis]WPP51242.1 hypothetical protein PZB72_02410 [Catalinimonas niigatensis]